MQIISSTGSETQFKTVSGDVIGLKQYTLSNGLRLMLTVNKHEPRVYTEIAVRVGSKHDPADTTGLAHYFEHMMFKGTDRLGSLDWDKEKPLLDQIEQLFEQHRAEPDPERKKELYRQIDQRSFEAAKFAAANEYDKMVSAIGAKGTNAYTWVEQTVYVNDIPSNELERWFELESERFRRPVLRLFHTELETVFEEYNMSQDRDFRKTMRVVQAALTPSHPYGTQTTLGRGEDLKNPSQTNIYRFFDQYYVPNNMAIIMSGDFDPDQVVALAEKYFGTFQAKPIPAFKYKPQPELTARIQQEVYGNEAPWIEMAWRFPGAKSKETALLPLISNLLHNYQAGLFDLNLIQQQQVLEAYAYPRIYEDYASLHFYAKPREGQTHEQLEQLLLGELDKLHQGDFEAWLPEAVMKDLRLSEFREFEKNQGRASALTSAFILGLEWSEMLRRRKQLEKVTKAEIVAFVQKNLRTDNYVVVYKHQGPDPSVMKVDKPPITPVEVNREDSSAFATQFYAKNTDDIQPAFIDFQKVIQSATLKPGVKLRAVRQPKRPMFQLDYCFDMGKTSDRRLGVLAGYLPFLGTSKYTPQQLQQQLYRLGLNCYATCNEEHFYITLTGLSESFEAGIQLMEHLIADAQPDIASYQNLVMDILQRRENDKSDKRVILSKGMASYAKYGKISPFTSKLSKEQLLALQPSELTDLLRSMRQYRHEIFYTGPESTRKVAKLLKQYHQTAEKPLKPLPPQRKYKELATNENKVLFVHFPMVQVELLLLSKGTPKFSLDEYVFAEWYNQYFGAGLSSIVFQEIRESKALAYSAYAFATTPPKKNRAHYLQAYVGTQPDKLREAVEAMQHILEDMPVSPQQMETARLSVLKQIAASRIMPGDLYWTWRNNLDRGVKTDLRETVYNHIQQVKPEDLISYQHKHVKGRKYTWLVLGDRKAVDFDYLKKIGKVTKLKLEDIFGY